MQDFDELAELVDLAKQMAPEISNIVDTLVNEYGPILSKVLDPISERIVDNKIKAYKKYTEAGISPDHAIQLILNSFSGSVLSNTLETMAKNFKLDFNTK